MTVTLATIRPMVQRLVGDWIPENTITTTTAIAASNLVISTSLAHYHNDNFNDTHYVHILTGANAAAIRKISDFATTTGQITVYGAALSTDGATQATFNVVKFHPNDVLQAINDATYEVYPALSVPQFLPNDHFEDWSQTTYPNYWNISGTGLTAAVETGATKIHNGAASAKVIRVGTDGYLYISTTQGTDELPVSVYNGLWNLRGQKCKFAKWVWASSALQARLSIYCGSTPDLAWYSPYHTGGSTFEYLETPEITIPWGVGEVGFRCEVNTTNGTVYFDGPGRSPLGSIPNLGVLSSLSADTDAIELTQEQAVGLAHYAGYIFLSRYAADQDANTVSRYQAKALELKATGQQLLGIHQTSKMFPKINYGWLEDL